MFREYASLRLVPLQSTSGLTVAAVTRPPTVTLDSSAALVMTDFRLVPAATIEPNAGLDLASDYMRRRNLRMLLVIDALGAVIGILTTTDVLGEKPVKFALEYGVKHNEIRVSDMMTPRSLLELLRFKEVENACVGHVVATLRQAGRQHLLVGEATQDGEQVRGIFSLSQIARQLGVDLQPHSFAQSFADIELALSR